MPITSGINANVFRAISGSLFSTAANWSRGVVPTGSDVAMIGDNCVIDISRTIGTLVVRSGFTASINTGLTFQVNDTINVLGHLSCSGNPTVLVASAKNNINSLSPGSSTFNFSKSGNQSVPGVTYNNLTVSNIGTKTLIGHATLNGNLNQSAGTFELSIYNLSVNGTSTINASIISKTGGGNLLFVGSLDIATGGTAGMNFSGNPNVEFRNGSDIGLYPMSVFNTGAGQWKYTTNNQNLRVSNNFYTYNCSFLISGAITLTIVPASGTESGINLTNIFDGDNASSKLVLGNASATKVVLGLRSRIMPMATFGTFDFTTNANSVLQFMQTETFTIPYSSFRGLYINTTSVSTLTLSANTIVDGNLRFYGGILECSSYALTVNGTTDAPSAIQTGLKKNSSTGLLLFVGNVNINTHGPYTFDLSVGNPNVEFRGGFGNVPTSAYPTTNIKSGTGIWTFSTNNQSLANGNNNTLTLDCSIIISGTITLTVAMGTNITMTLNGSINGNNASSKLLVATSTVLNFGTQVAAQNSMTTGIVDFTTNVNTISYSGNYTATIPSNFTAFHNLTIAGTGTKSLGANTTLNGNLSNNGLFELSTFNFTVTGTTTGNLGSLTKSGGGNVLFIGQIGAVVGNAAFIDFSMSTCNVECRGGIDLINGSTIKTSPTGTWTFTTNNQNIINSGGNAGNIIFNGPVVIGNNISVSNYLGTFGFLNFYSTLNGSNSSSSLINRGSIILYNSTPVMTTGTLNITSFVNTLQLNFAGSMNLQFSDYYNLVINETGIKSAVGNISILGTLNIPIGGMELGIYNLVVDGNTICRSLTKSGGGSVLFKGALQGVNGVSAAGGVVDFSVGNPLVECRGGIYFVNNGTDAIKTGTGTWTFTTNNQVIDWNAGSGGAMIFSCNVLISGAIILSLNRVVTFNQSVDGNNASSRLLVGTNTPTITYNAATRPMVTGLLDTSTNLNTWIYGNSNQDIKGNTYRNLTLNGGGTKTLQGNVSVQNTYTLTAPATLNNNGFTLTNP